MARLDLNALSRGYVCKSTILSKDSIKEFEINKENRINSKKINATNLFSAKIETKSR